MKGFISEVLVSGAWSRNAVVWPDEESAQSAGADLMGRWMLVQDFRSVSVEEQPNRPTWAEQVALRGLPPKSVQL
jgi:hypothetical protein